MNTPMSIKGGIYLDDETLLVREHFAVVPARKPGRQRFAEGCVEVVATEAVARAGANPAAGRHAARVAGPARSSEGVRLYYLVYWLE